MSAIMASPGIAKSGIKTQLSPWLASSLSSFGLSSYDVKCVSLAETIHLVISICFLSFLFLLSLHSFSFF
jgi:hypothetical protein